ncbi:hypothetical protein [Thioalbus denitrificans]|uniref:Uncharacterized protein n=1 Tax=Thioalbus denitrificans TaxID=547122 RepID=A0A369CAW5_9GAMM|nr:hypothetical protein [Thioalbus denitrificans]RCX31172.1 hypothetical protein DFQ59_103136 [Thioalbus denitrificans]
MPGFRGALLLVPLLLMPALAAATEPLWFSDLPPTAEWAGKTRRAHGGLVERGRGGVTAKRLWLRAGDDPARAAYVPVPAGAVVAEGPGPDPVTPKPFGADAGGGIRFEMPEEGFYNAYLLSREVRDGTLEARVVKAEVLMHSCANGHDRRFTEARMPPRITAGVPFELIRERRPDEDFHSRAVSGEAIAFLALRQGEPVAGAEVRLVSNTGWSKTVTTGADGRAEFRMVRDYYTDWSEFDKRRRQDYLVLAEYRQPQAGELDGRAYTQVHYSASLAGTYYPAGREYQSYLYGLGVMLFAASLSVGGVYHYRLRQRRPERREAFDEKA